MALPGNSKKKYIDELSKLELENLKNKKIAGIDPNEYDLAYLIAERTGPQIPYVLKDQLKTKRPALHSKKKELLKLQDIRTEKSKMHAEDQRSRIREETNFDESEVHETGKSHHLRNQKNKWVTDVYTAGRRKFERRTDSLKKSAQEFKDQFTFVLDRNSNTTTLWQTIDEVDILIKTFQFVPDIGNVSSFSVEDLILYLSQFSAKCLTLNELQSYCKAKLEHDELLFPVYHSKLFRRNKLLAYMNNQKSEAAWIDRLKSRVM
ncbi:hypothetical protein GEMRC1_011883 [Eukaryota sp. GEM-RC1]